MSESSPKPQQNLLDAFLSSDRKRFEDRKHSVGGYQTITVEECVDRLTRLAQISNASIETPTSPESWKDLELPKDRIRGYINADDLQSNPDRYRIIRTKGITLVVSLGSDQYFSGDFYRDGKHIGGNHDFSLHELAIGLR